MNTTDRNRGRTGEEPVGRTSVQERQSTPLEQMGGPMGFVYSAIPVVVFVAANAFLPLSVTIMVSVAVGLGMVGYRMLRGERFGLAAGGILGLALAIGVVPLRLMALDE